MPKAFQVRVTAIVLALLTAAACVLGIMNFLREARFELPTDGVWWVESQGGLRAERVPLNSPAQRAGIRPGDLLVSVDEHPTPRVASLNRQIFRHGVWSRGTYSVRRDGGKSRFDVQVIFEPADRSINQGMRLIGLVYLGIGLYVLFRRWTAPGSLHFYLFCLASFVLYAFKYTGELDALDQTVFYGNLLAGALQPALFLHFAVSFGRSSNSLPRRILSGALYLPGFIVGTLQILAITVWSATEQLHHRLDQISIGYLSAFYVTAAIVFYTRYRRARSGLERQQLKWLSRGALIAVVPFTLLYTIPYMADWDIWPIVAKLSGLSLVFLPLTFSWAIVRYRLMDVDLIFKRGVTYTLATAGLVGLYFAVIAVSAELVHTRLPNLRAWGLVAAIVVTSLIFDPLKNVIQERVDKLFDRRRFDYRSTLIDFGRSLSSQTDINLLTRSIVERLQQTLLVTRLALFTSDEQGAPLHLAASHGLSEVVLGDLSFLDFSSGARHLFLETPQHALHLPESQQSTAAALDLNYYLACTVGDPATHSQRTIAVIGLGRTSRGDFLSSEDIEVLESLAGYIGIAIQNAQLYTRLQRQVNEFERLKEFNENIVESIHIGIFAVDLEDRIESWNAEMEVMYATSRGSALRRPLNEVFPEEFVTEFGRLKSEATTHTLYKFRLPTPTGEIRTANIAIAPLLTRDFVPVGRIVLVDDITDRVNMEGQLAQAEKLSSIGLLAAGIAHEVNTPLAVISSYAQMLTKHAGGDPRLSPILEKITQQTFRASEIANGLLNFSRTSTTEFTQLNVNTVMRDTIALLEHQMKTSRVKLDVDMAEDLPFIRGNQGKLQQVALNLLMNAKDALFDRPEGRLNVQTLSVNGNVIVRISDNGSGIDPANLHKIYDPFFTTKLQPAAGQRKGTGLGLSVTYGIMQEHNGKIDVESEPGVGTVFTLEFPALPGSTRLGTEASGRTIHA
ncbi:ATP-binding protein [Terriglobus tenax]|uniref:ATP-binding protein n=1 Tax=Terriglobus tenax TaxID=1111115 RepID=UPI0021DFDE95|nr:ATP-binding protein [Terriglobus tenax]